MDYRLDGVRTAIALALGLSPAVVGCSARVMDDGGERNGGTESPPGSTSGPGSTGAVVDDTGSSDDSGSSWSSGDSTGALDTSGGAIRSCNADGYPYVDFCFGTPNSEDECVCEGDCQREASTLAWETFPDPGCGFFYNQTVCAETWEGQCCFTASVYDDFCGKGRPLIVDDRPHVASPVLGDGWGTQTPVEVRPAVAEYWLDAALEEHASVASFARFALELISVGAPAELLADTAAAMRDEVRHAELALALAGRFGALPLQPGFLDSGPARSVALEDVVVATVREGCIGETLAAAQAELALQRATDPAVVSALQEIAVDEARHAALAWRVVQWALSVDPSLRGAVERAFATSTDLDVAPKFPFESGLEGYGVLGAEATEAVRLQTLRETVRPFADALLNGRSDRRARAV